MACPCGRTTNSRLDWVHHTTHGWLLTLHIAVAIIITLMALLSPDFLECVVALGTPSDEEKSIWIASGFLFGRFIQKVDEQTSRYRVVLVSNRHVFLGLEWLTMRFNPEEGQQASEFRVALNENGKQRWFSHPDENIDVAVLPISTDTLRQHKIKFNFFRSNNQSADLAKLEKLGISEGDGVFVLGFPMGIVGTQRSYVIVRGGNIARIRDCIAGSSSDFLIDAPVFPGNSGSPVILRPEIASIEGTEAVSESYLIGIVKSYIPYQDIAISPQTKRQRVVFEENSGLASVEPVDHIQKTIESIQPVELE